MKEHRLEYVSVDDCDPDPMNPQVQDLPTFNELVEDIRENGMTEAITVTPHGEGRYRIVAGEHRWKASRLAGLDRVPVLIVPEEQWAADERRIQLVRKNVLRGKLDGGKFAEVWFDLLKRIPDQNELARKMGFDARGSELNKLVRTVERAMPDERMKSELAKRKDSIRSVEDLASTVQSLFARYGSTLESSFVVFSFMGQSHLMVRCSPESFAPIRELAQRVADDGGKMDEELSRLAASRLAETETQPVG